MGGIETFMIGYLEGTLPRHKTPDYIIIDTHGVGYQVHIPLSTFYELPEPGRTVSLNIHTYVREDTLQLYGFRTTAEKEMFLHLITVNGVGPRLAVGILSRISSDELTRVVYQNDPVRLRKVPGCGQEDSGPAPVGIAGPVEGARRAGRGNPRGVP